MIYKESMMKSPILNQVGTLFIPVKEIEQARDWYCQLLNQPTTGDILFGHLYIISLSNGVDFVLDSNIYSSERILKTPTIQLLTKDIHAAYAYMQEQHIELVTTVQSDKWFNFKDPDGNLLMICS